jgi:hypothetical protein
MYRIRSFAKSTDRQRYKGTMGGEGEMCSKIYRKTLQKRSFG